jgi:hypothetical protein
MKVPKDNGMTKSQQIARLLLREEGCSYSEALAVSGWQSISMQRHAKNNGLRLRIEKINGHRTRYFGEYRKIEVHKVVRPWQPKIQITPLAALCAANGFAIIERKGRVLTCQHCYLGFRIFQKDNSVNPYLRKHLQQHAETHRRHETKKEKVHE